MFDFITCALSFFNIDCLFGGIFWCFVGVSLAGLMIKPIFN